MTRDWRRDNHLLREYHDRRFEFLEVEVDYVLEGKRDIKRCGRLFVEGKHDDQRLDGAVVVVG